MDFKEDMARIKFNEIPASLTEKAKQSIKDCAVTRCPDNKIKSHAKGGTIGRYFRKNEY